MKMQVVSCPNCNGEVQIDASRGFGFCTFCGTKLMFSEDAPLNAQQAFTSNREAALAEIQNIADHFEPVSENFGRVDKINRYINGLMKKSYSSYTAIGVIMIFIGIFCALKKSMVPTVLTILIGVLVVLLGKVLTDRNRLAINDAISERAQLSKEIVDAYNSYPHCPMGIEYCNPQMIHVLYEYIRKGRAETIKEAINLLAADTHNAEMKQIALDTQSIAEQNLWMNTINNFVK